MRIREVLIRWYKSFNYDYELKAHVNAKPQTWQETPDGWLPHVRINLEHDITAVVGANESGKSHLLAAINIVLTGKDHSQNDFCRYSTLFSVEKGQRRFPEVGATFELSDADTAAVDELGIPVLANGDLLMLRPDPSRIDVLDSANKLLTLDDEQVKGLQGLLPHAYQLKTQVELPDSVSIAALVQGTTRMATRKRRYELFRLLFGFGAEAEVTQKAGTLFALLSAAEDGETEEQKLGRGLAHQGRPNRDVGVQGPAGRHRE